MFVNRLSRVLLIYEAFIFGIHGLDKIFKDILTPPTMIVIVGHPGAGKTTLASQICYSNVLNRHRCIYLSFQEDRDKLFRNMKRLGLDLASMEASGNLMFIKLPVVLSIDSVVSEISSIINSFNPDIVVIDSINVLLNSVGREEVKRAWLQNYFYELAKQINGLVILVVELPFGEEKIQLGAIEFISDAIFILKHRIIRHLLERYLEIRKTRGAPITVAEIPFVIVEGVGIQIEPMEPPLTIPAEGEELNLICEEFKEIIKELKKGEKVYVSYPPDARIVEGPGIAPYLLSLAIVNNTKILVLSYKYSDKTFKNMFTEQIIELGIDRDIAEKLVDRYITFIGLNPFAVPISYYLPLLQKISPDTGIVVFHGLEARFIAMDSRSYAVRYFDAMVKMKSARILDIALSARISKKQYNIDTSFSDIIIKIVLNKERIPKVYIWRKGGVPQILNLNQIKACLNKIAEIIKLESRR